MMTRIFKRGVVFAIFILAFAFFLQEAKACEHNITDCTTINQSGVWCLQNDINDTLSELCFLVTASNVIFDGQGYVVDGIFRFNTQGFKILSVNVTIKNVTITDWYEGVYIDGANGNNVTIESITTNRTFYGIHIGDSNYNTIFNNSIFGSNMTGVHVVGGSYNNISNNLITVTESFKTQYGIWFLRGVTSAADNNIVEGNVLTSVNFSIKLENSHKNTITRNAIINSIQAGFELTNSHNNNLAENNITNANLAGIKMNSSNYNNITSNNFYSIGNSSFAVFNSTENNFSNNVVNYAYGSCFDLLLSPKNYFANNSMTNLAGAGFYLNASNNNTLFNNTIENVTQAAGINLFDSNYTNATLNTIIEPSEAGSFIESSYYNYFENNSFLNVSTTAKAINLISSDYNVFKKGKLTCTAAGYYPSTFLMIALINSKSNFFSEMEADLGGCQSPSITRCGFLLQDGSENNTIKNSIVQNSNLGIFFEPSSGNNNTIENNSFINITAASNNDSYRAAISATGLQKIINNNFTLCDYCIELRNSSSLIENNTISQDTIAALYSIDSEAIIKNLTLETLNTRTSISARGLNYSIKSQEIMKQPSPPLYAINKSFNATLLNENSFAEINVSYNESELPFPYEENLRMYYYNFSASGGGGPGGEGEWIKISESGVNPDDNYVWSRINTTTFRSNKSYHFAPLLSLREENVSECRTLNESGYYRLNQSVSSEGTCFNITASYVVLDCKGLDGNYHSITYSQASFGYAVNISAQDVIVKNCYISSQFSQPNECSPPTGDWCHGIFSNESKVTVLNNTFNYPLGPSFEEMYAIYLTNRSKIENNMIFFQTQSGKGIFAGSNNTIQGNRIQNCLNGINITGSNNAMQENAFSSNIQDVVISLQGTNNTLTRDNFTGTIVSLSLNDETPPPPGTIVVNSVVSPPSDPDENWSNISKYINITTSGNNLNINLSISYLQEELGNIKESSLRMWKYTNHWEWCTNTGVDVVNNYVWCEDRIEPTLPAASYIFAPLGNETIESIRAPENFSIFLREDNATVKLNWSKVDEADGYYIWYSDNVTWILQLNESNAPEPNVTLAGSNSTEWNDTTANETTKRFYALAAFAGSLKNLSSDRLGKHTLTIDTTNKIISLPLEENKSIQEIPGMEGAKIYYTKKDSNSDSYVWYTQGAWRNEEGQISNLKLIFGYGYYFFNFTSTQFVNVGKIPTGNTNFTINQGQTLFGWESYTEGNFTELVVPQEGAKVYYINETGDDRYIWATQERWRNESGKPFDLTLESSKGYYCFNFTTEVNMTYERNPH